MNKSQKLANAANTDAVQHVTVTGGVVDFPASVDFSRPFMLQAPNGFPPPSSSPARSARPATAR